MTHLNTEIANNDFIYSMSRLPHLAALGRHLSEMMYIINQPKFKAGHSKPLEIHPPFSVELAGRSQQQGGDRLREGAPNRSFSPASIEADFKA